MYIPITEFLKSPPRGLKRGGIVPYVDRFIPDKGLIRFYCLGLDYSSGDITEFSGKVDKKDHDIIDTSLREFQEETRNVFPPITREDLISQNVNVLYDNLALIIFVRVDVDMLDIVDRFDNYSQPFIDRYEEEATLIPELSTLIWLTEAQLSISLEQNNVPPVLFYYPSGRLLLQKFSNRATDQCQSLGKTGSY